MADHWFDPRPSPRQNTHIYIISTLRFCTVKHLVCYFGFRCSDFHKDTRPPHFYHLYIGVAHYPQLAETFATLVGTVVALY